MPPGTSSITDRLRAIGQFADGNPRSSNGRGFTALMRFLLAIDCGVAPYFMSRLLDHIDGLPLSGCSDTPVGEDRNRCGA